jgi:hypothetical protein
VNSTINLKWLTETALLVLLRGTLRDDVTLCTFQKYWKTKTSQKRGQEKNNIVLLVDGVQVT